MGQEGATYHMGTIINAITFTIGKTSKLLTKQKLNSSLLQA